MSQAGMLLQVDGSRHDWLEGRGQWLTLVGAVDDATGIVTGATFRLQEDAAGYLAALTQTAHGYGLPLGVYSDRHTIFWRGKGTPTIAEQFRGERARTQVGTALEAGGIAWIGAHSPQAKGRVERLWGIAAAADADPPARRLTQHAAPAQAGQHPSDHRRRQVHPAAAQEHGQLGLAPARVALT